jgi:hypothetical protein
MMMAARIASLASKTALSATFVASTAFISYHGDLKSKRQATASTPPHPAHEDAKEDSLTAHRSNLRHVSSRNETQADDQFFFTHDDDQRFLETAVHVLTKARHEMQSSSSSDSVPSSSSGSFWSQHSTILRQAHVRAMVMDRFLDLMTRSARALVDYQLHALLHDAAGNEQALSQLHYRTAQSMHDACALHGGILVKLGQYLAANAAGGLLPKEYGEALSPLQDACAPLSMPVVEQLINEQLLSLRPDLFVVVVDDDELSNKHEMDLSSYKQQQQQQQQSLWRRVFRDIDPIPLGSASLAQVHAATLHDGRRVAIKVQRPNLDVITRADIVALSLLSKAIEMSFPGTGFDWLL